MADGKVFLKDKDWKPIEEKWCLVKGFTQMSGFMEDGKVKSLDKTTPYGSITFICNDLEGEHTGFVTHKLEFLALWRIYKERKVKKNEEVIMAWSTHNIKGVFKHMTSVFPKMNFYIMHKNGYKALTDGNFRSQLLPEEDAKLTEPIERFQSADLKEGY